MFKALEKITGYQPIENKALEIVKEIDRIESKNILLNIQEARLEYIRAQTYDIVTRAAWSARVKENKPIEKPTSDGTTPEGNTITPIQEVKITCKTLETTSKDKLSVEFADCISEEKINNL